MNRLTTSILALTIAAGGAMAESHTNLEDAEQNLENAAEETGEAVENTADAAGNAAEDAAQATENAAEDAAQATENAAEDAAEANENAAEETGDALQNAGNELEENAQEMAEGMDILDPAQLIRTRDITGGPVYTVDGENGVAEFGAESYSEVGDTWNRIGEIEDIVLSKEGQMRGVVLEIGGFLDLGDKHIFMQMDNVQLVPVDDRSYAIAVGQTEEELEEMESVDEAFWQ